MILNEIFASTTLHDARFLGNEAGAQSPASSGRIALCCSTKSFAGTNEREGAEIGYQVVHALLDAEIKVFFVTHRFAFAERFHRQYARFTLFLRAERQPDGHRNYKLAVKDPLPTSYGEDLYYQLGVWLDEDKALAPVPGT